MANRVPGNWLPQNFKDWEEKWNRVADMKSEEGRNKKRRNVRMKENNLKADITDGSV